MKRTWLLVFVFVLLTALLCGCYSEPHAQYYELSNYVKMVRFSNGVEREVTCTGTPSLAMPFDGAENISIRFLENGTVEVQPRGEELLTGTYTSYDDQKVLITYCHVTLDNGETFDAQIEKKGKNIVLGVQFRNVDYIFSGKDEITAPEGELYEFRLESFVIDILRSWEKADSFTGGYRGTVTKKNGVYSLQMIDGLGNENSRTTLSLDDTVAVYCARLNAQDTLTFLSAIEEGECFCVPTMEDGKVTMVTIYYLDPV